jgi:hypothetical protein
MNKTLAIAWVIGVIVFGSRASSAFVLAEDKTVEAVAKIIEAEDEEFDIDQYEVVPGRRNLQDGPPGFAIDLVFTTKITAAQKQGFIQARDRWQSIITADHASIACIRAKTRICGRKFTRRTCIDDLMILVKVAPIDGTGKMYVHLCPVSARIIINTNESQFGSRWAVWYEHGQGSPWRNDV